MNNLTKSQYKCLTDSKSPKPVFGKNLIFAFVIGGTICIIGQVITELYMHSGVGKNTSAAATSITLIFVGAILTGLGLYDKIAKYAGAGTIVPITGFANSIVAPAMEHKSEGYVLGMAAKMFIIAGPVLVFGIASSVFAGLVLWILQIR